MAAKHLIYGLSDPRDGQLRYVGKSESGMVRPKSHQSPSKLAACSHKANWIRQLQALGLTYQIVLLQELDGKEILGQAEVFWIAYFRAMGCKLTNLTDGGNGAVGYTHSEATLAKMSRSRMGKTHSAATRAKISARRGGRTLTNTTKAKISAALIGRVKSADTKRKMSVASKERMTDPATRAKIAKAMRGNSNRSKNVNLHYIMPR